jgi:hypothetical protein
LGGESVCRFPSPESFQQRVQARLDNGGVDIDVGNFGLAGGRANVHLQPIRRLETAGFFTPDKKERESFTVILRGISSKVKSNALSGLLADDHSGLPGFS